MTHIHRTKDESYLLSLCEEALKQGSKEIPIDRYRAGEKAGIHPKGVDAICKLLIQANFIKKSGESSVYLTPHGIKLIDKLLLE